MHKFLVFVCSLLASLPVLATDYSAYHKIAASVIRVVANVPGVGTSFGSGVVLPGGRVVTNCHVMPDARRVAVIDGAARTEAVANSGDFSADLCVLETGPLVAPAARMGGTDSLQVGDDVVAIGFGAAGARSISAGKVTALYPYRGGQVIRSTAAFRQGASGGGLFDRHGNLVGITTFYRRGGSEFSFFAIPVDWIGNLPLAAADSLPHASPFWMRSHAEQPHFLQVATLEADGKWVEMAEAARLWSTEEPAQAQEALSRALSAQGQDTESSAGKQGTRKTAGADNAMRE